LLKYSISAFGREGRRALRCCGCEDPVVAYEVVGEGTEEDGEQVREQERGVGEVQEEAHKEKVAEQGDGTVGEVEAGEGPEGCGGLAAVSPGEVPVPGKVVEQGEFYRRGGGGEGVGGVGVVEERERA
jgi:hypothetical protein